MDLILSFWSFNTPKRNTNTLKQLIQSPSNIAKIILSTEGEYNSQSIFIKIADPNLITETIDTIIKYNIPIYAIEAKAYGKDYFKGTEVEKLSPYITYTEPWDSYYIHNSVRIFKLFSNYQQPTNYNNHFIYMNGRLRSHRIALREAITEAGLLDNCAYSWYNSYIQANYLTTNIIEHKYPAKDLTECLPTNNKSNMPLADMLCYCPPKEYNESFVQVIAETSMDDLFITEKTVIPLLHMKPFLLLAKENTYAYLQNEFGFKLYDELFDYSFDSDPILENRINGIVENMKRIASMNQIEMQNAYKQIYSKLKYNHDLAEHIGTSKEYIPKFLLDIYNALPANHDPKILSAYLISWILQDNKFKLKKRNTNE